MKVRHERGFSLIEIMMTVAITSILASLAVPGYLKMTFRAKTTEARTNLGAIKVGMLSHEASLGGFRDVQVEPAMPITGVRKDWPATPASALPIPPGSAITFATIGFEPAGTVHYHYGCVSGAQSFRCEAASELDNAPPNGVFRLTHTDSDAPPALTGPFDATQVQVWNAGVESVRPWIY